MTYTVRAKKNNHASAVSVYDQINIGNSREHALEVIRSNIPRGRSKNQFHIDSSRIRYWPHSSVFHISWGVDIILHNGKVISVTLYEFDDGHVIASKMLRETSPHSDRGLPP